MSSSENDPQLSEEIAHYDALKLRLEKLWRSLFPADEAHYTSVVIPSVTVPSEVLDLVPGSTSYEESLLFFIIRLRNPKARLVYVTSQPIHPIVPEYYLQFLTGIPASHARKRLTLISAYDGSARPLTQKILERPRLMQRIRAAIPEHDRAYMTTFNVTPLERKLAVQLDLPINGADPRWLFANRSGSRKVLREAGLEPPPGIEDLNRESEVLEALDELRSRHPRIERAVLRLNQSYWGDGIAEYRYPSEGSRDALRRALGRVVPSLSTDDVGTFLAKYERRGGTVEERLVGAEVRSPSVQIRVTPAGIVSVTSTHEEIVGAPTGLVITGCRFPAEDVYRAQLYEIGHRLGATLAARGIASRVSVDCVARREGAESAWQLTPVGFNLGVGGTTHPLLAVRLLTGGHVDPETGLFRSATGRPKYYRANDHLQSPSYRGLLPDDLIEMLTIKGLSYSPHVESGVIVYMLGALSEHGRVGLLAIGDSREQAEQVYRSAVRAIDDETGAGQENPRPG